jgi:hypothetical protein
MLVRGSVLMCALVLASSACGSDAPATEVPQGDDLDELLNLSTGEDFYLATIASCVESLGVDPNGIPTQADVSEPPQDVGTGSGVVEQAILALTNPQDESLPLSEQLPPTLYSALFDELKIDGQTYAGCTGFAESERNALPVEILRIDLSDKYASEVGLRMFADSGWIALDEAWADCMTNAGYAGYDRPGDQLRMLMEETAAASTDLARLTELLRLDVAVTNASIGCDDRDARIAIRQTYESDFVRRYSNDLTRLILLRDEDK